MNHRTQSKSRYERAQEANRMSHSVPLTHQTSGLIITRKPSEKDIREHMKDETFSALYYALDAIVLTGGPAKSLQWGPGEHSCRFWSWELLTVGDYVIPVPVYSDKEQVTLYGYSDNAQSFSHYEAVIIIGFVMLTWLSSLARDNQDSLIKSFGIFAALLVKKGAVAASKMNNVERTLKIACYDIPGSLSILS
jgi:hypothetical protein